MLIIYIVSPNKKTKIGICAFIFEILKTVRFSYLMLFDTIKVILDWMRTKITLKTECFIFSNSKAYANKLIAF